MLLSKSKGSRRSITRPGPSKWLRRSDQVPASGGRRPYEHMSQEMLEAEEARLQNQKIILRQGQLIKMAQSDTLRKLLNPLGRPQPSAAGDRDLAAEADLLQFKQERRKIQRALNLIVTEKRVRGVLPAFGGPEVYQALAVGTRACDAPQDMKDVAWLVGAPELAFGGKCPTADQWLAGEAPQGAEVQRDIGGSTASAWKGGHPIF